MVCQAELGHVSMKCNELSCNMFCGVCGFGMTSWSAFIIFIFVFLLCWRIGMGCLAQKLLSSAWAWFPCRRGNFWMCFSSYLPRCQEFNNDLKIWNWLRGLWVWILSYSSIKNSASTEQKIKPNFDGEAILHSRKQSKDSQSFTEQNKVKGKIEVSRRRKGRVKRWEHNQIRN